MTGRMDRSDLANIVRHRKKLTSKNARKRRLPRAPVPAPPIKQIQDYRKLAKEYFNKLRELVERIIIPKIEPILTEARRHHPEGSHLDDLPDDIKNLISILDLNFEGEFTEEELVNKIGIIGNGVSDVNRKNNLNAVRSVLAIDITYEEPYLETFLAAFAFQNAEMISGVKDKLLDTVSELVFDAFRTGTRAEDLADDIRDAMDTSESRANFVARDQISKLNGELDRFRQTEAGVGKYRWRTMGDDRVRDTHMEQDGEIYDWDDPPVETGHPGEDYNCRCWAEPIFDDLDQSDDSDAESGGDEA